MTSTAQTKAAAMSARALTKTYGVGDTQVVAVGGVDLDVAPGEVVLIMGPSGSGKTTLLLMLGALLRPTSGSLIINGIETTKAPHRALPRLRATHFGFVFQDYNLLGALSARENVELACNLAGTTGSRSRARATELLDRFGLADRAGFRPEQLSGGEKQRVSLARALANDPAVVLADEPTANLDSARGHEIARLLRRLADEDRRSIVIVSHDQRLREVADRILWLEDGVFQELAIMAVDPVCGMPVSRSGPSVQVDGATLWFCANGCRDEYEQRRQQHLRGVALR
jgi:putative ABC transport system ATP-binding protein